LFDANSGAVQSLQKPAADESLSSFNPVSRSPRPLP
jgi:hypothetical protein